MGRRCGGGCGPRGGPGGRGGRRPALSADARGYYARPVLKEPVWRHEVAAYFFAGGLAGASAGLSFFARVAGNRVLARRALVVAMAALASSPPLLIADLGRPERFLNMLRVIKPTSPMSIGSWVLSAFGAALSTAFAGEFLGLLRPLRGVASLSAAVLGLPLATYTAVLLGDTSTPIWHRARHHLPFVFAGGAAASAGGIAAMVTPAADAGPARRLAVFGAAVELAAVVLMDRALGGAAAPYHRGEAGRMATAAVACAATGGALMLFAGRRRPVAVVAGALVGAGALAERFAVVLAGPDSARSTTG